MELSKTLTGKLPVGIPVGTNISKPVDKQLISADKKFDNDILLEDLEDLINPKFKGWYCKRFYELGKDKVLRLASIARADGKNKQRLFSYLLKKG